MVPIVISSPTARCDWDWRVDVVVVAPESVPSGWRRPPPPPKEGRRTRRCCFFGSSSAPDVEAVPTLAGGSLEEEGLIVVKIIYKL